MKKFYDREHEMEQLRDMQQQAYEDYSRFVVLTGRRRVGKTSLVYRLMEETKEEAPGLYFFVGRKTEATLVRTFCEEVRTRLEEYVPEGISTFRGLLQLLLEIGKRRRFTLFIDEFQEFDNVNAGVFSDVEQGDGYLFQIEYEQLDNKEVKECLGKLENHQELVYIT